MKFTTNILTAERLPTEQYPNRQRVECTFDDASPAYFFYSGVTTDWTRLTGTKVEIACHVKRETVRNGMMLDFVRVVKVKPAR